MRWLVLLFSGGATVGLVMWAMEVHRTELHSWKENVLFGGAALCALLFLFLTSGRKCYGRCAERHKGGGQ